MVQLTGEDPLMALLTEEDPAHLIVEVALTVVTHLLDPEVTEAVLVPADLEEVRIEEVLEALEEDIKKNSNLTLTT